MALVTGQSLYKALQPLMDALGINSDATKEITFHMDSQGAATYTVQSFVSEEQAEKLKEVVNG